MSNLVKFKKIKHFYNVLSHFYTKPFLKIKVTNVKYPDPYFYLNRNFNKYLKVKKKKRRRE